jgi:hypothetical protein
MTASSKEVPLSGKEVPVSGVLDQERDWGGSHKSELDIRTPATADPHTNQLRQRLRMEAGAHTQNYSHDGSNSGARTTHHQN